MGGCVSSVMAARNDSSMIEHKIIAGYRTYGTENEPVCPATADDESAIYRFANTSDEAHAQLVKENYYGPNWVASLRQRAREIPDRPAMGYRVLEKIERRPVKDPSTGKEKVFEYYHCSPYKSISFKDMWMGMESFSRGLAKLGLTDGANVSIYEESRWEWVVSIYGIWLQGMVATTVYANLGEDALAYALAETQSEAIVCNARGVPVLLRLLEKSERKPVIIYLDDLQAGADTLETAEKSGFKVVPWQTVVDAGAAAAESIEVHVPTNNDAVALIMYTSGTTGNPKGVMHSHGAIAAGIRALNERVLEMYRPNEDGEIYCAYLPLAHILELAVVNIFLVRGSMVGFGSPRTLTDAFCLPHGDLREFKPKVIIAVPRIFDTIRKSVEAKLPPRGSVKRTVFDKAFASRRAAILSAKDTPYWNNKVFAMVRNVLGGGVYGMLSGGGPLSPSTQEFINVMCGGPLIIQGWGLTETICCGATQRLGDLEPNCNGQLVKTAEMKLKDVGAEYKHTDEPEPRGEICLRGPFLFKGYYKNEVLTKEVLDEEGFFHTGDIGSVSPEGKIRIIGRVKALAKNSLGEYIALEMLESIYGINDIAAINGVCVLVHPEKSYIAALVLTDEKRAGEFAVASGMGSVLRAKGYPAILEDKQYLIAASKSFAETARAAGRMKFELVQKVRVLDEQWTPENGLLTPTSKLRRSMIEKHYAKIIEELFTN